MANEERMSENERIQMERIRDLDMEVLQIEEVDDDYCSSSDDCINEYGGTGEYEVDDACHRVGFFDGGTILNLPMLYFEGVLFPEATLPVNDIQPRFTAAIERARDQVVAPNTIAVVRAYFHPDDGNLRFAKIGTTAKIQQYQQLEEGCFSVLARGQQRFHMRRHWIDGDGAPCAEVQIMTEELPFRTPRDAFGQLASVINFYKHSISHQVSSDASNSKHGSCHEDNGSESMSDTSFENELSPIELQMHLSVIKSSRRYGGTDELASKYNDQIVRESRYHLGGAYPDDSGGSSQHNCSGGSRSHCDWLGNRHQAALGNKTHNNVGWKKELAAAESKWLHRAPRSFLPHWVYRMYDSYSLAQRASVMWEQIIRVPNIDELSKKPDSLSFYIASKIPVSESLRQELLETDGISYRLRREIELLECFDPVCCKICQSVIAKRSEMLVMSADGPLGAYLNPHGYVNQVMTFDKANGLALTGTPVEECSWFHGYAWTNAACVTCKSHLGWLFTATNDKLKPRTFWAIQNFQVEDKIS